MEQREQAARGARARELLNDPVLNDAFAAARARFVDKSINASRLEDREAARAMVLALVEVRRELEVTSGDGEYAATALRRKQ